MSSVLFTPRHEQNVMEGNITFKADLFLYPKQYAC